MFVHAVKATKKGVKGAYCTLVESRRLEDGPVHEKVMSFGFIPEGRVPYLKAAFGAGDPAEILSAELGKLSGSVSTESGGRPV
ncbi:MAG: hypothetical protein IJ161_12625 [Bacteroidales bacterium]|nr:hypothetical protein [Bacteroidales bacterium]